MAREYDPVRVAKTLSEKYNYKPLPADLSVKYREWFKDKLPTELKLCIDGGVSDAVVISKQGLIISHGFNRIVVGDYGAFIEMDPAQIEKDSLIIKPGQEKRYTPEYNNSKYYWLCSQDDTNCKIYLQRSPVSYADYIPNMYYVSPYDVFIVSGPKAQGCQIKEEQRDLFEVKKEYTYIAHCISADFALGAGIAKEVAVRYNTRQQLCCDYPYFFDEYIVNGKQSDCLLTGTVLNLVTKKNYWDKPSLMSVRLSLEKMRDLMLSRNIKKVAMPRIGCGLDRLQWSSVKKIIEEVFKDTNIDILICYQ